MLAVLPPAAVAQDENEAPAATEQPAQPGKRVVVRFLTESDFPPFNFYDEDGVLVGFNVDVARAICLELDTACDIKVRPWGELLPALKRGEADAVIAAHAVTPEALAMVDFTDRYFYTPGRFVGRLGAEGDEPVEMTPEGLDGKRIGVAKNTAHEAFLKAFFRSSAIKSYETPDLARDALIQNQVDYVFDDGISLIFWLHGTASKRCCEMKGGPYLEPKYFGDGIAVAVPKNDQQIKTLINGALARLRADGRLDELVERYFPVKVY
jgi:polar amino acid transport system substrate-binding protein